MTEIIVVHEFDKSGSAPDPGAGTAAGSRAVRRVHAAPAAPGTPDVPGPRTMCGKDTFAMEATAWRSSEHPGSPWYGPEYADRVCTDCDLTMET